MLQVILARILEPECYGTLAVMLIFIDLANVFIQQGFGTALIQNKDVSEDDYSSVFWTVLVIASVLYGVLYFLAPFTEKFFAIRDFSDSFRFLALMLFPGALNSVQQAKLSRELDYRKIFISNLLGVVISGALGIFVALNYGGIWALVIQSFANTLIVSVVMLVTVKWKPRAVFDIKRMEELFSYGWKLQLSSLMDTGFEDAQAALVGKAFDSSILAFYDRGRQFPKFIISTINGAVQSVMLPVMSSQQEDINDVKTTMRKSLTMSFFFISPLILGLAAVADQAVVVILTEKWRPCVPYLQLYCLSYLFWPVHTCNLQAINAVGRSDIFLKLEIIKKIYGILGLYIAIRYFRSPIALVMVGVITVPLSCYVNAYPNKKLINYSLIEQIKDLIPIMFADIVMLIPVLLVGMADLPKILVLVLQVVCGAVCYIALNAVLGTQPWNDAIIMIKQRKDSGRNPI
ncbi:MAG: lipopolysaccharide biosynthesis protein [Lachnospiraceae bacterium]|nr:lipopolysaccharide biosynthesis protein [Lachnospiraceae bacterium]